MEISDEAEEILEALWTFTQKKGSQPISLRDLEIDKGDKALHELLNLEFIALSKGHVWLTSKGEPIAENIVRRHRLAECLLVYVLNTKINVVEEPACRLEHILRNGIEDSVCVLLGHPKICPHGNPIPPGRCCLENREKASRIVSSLSDLKPGQGGKVVYIRSDHPGKLRKLMAMGILPGVSITLIQRFPSYVFQTGQTQFAVDKEIAEKIFILITRKNMES